MNNSLFGALFGCTHRKTTFPQTPKLRSKTGGARSAAYPSSTYIVCLECGRELPYDWEHMRRVRMSPLARTALAFRRVLAPFRLRSAS